MVKQNKPVDGWRRRTHRDPHAPPSPLTCAECGGTKLVTKNGAQIYPHRPDLAHKVFWVCPKDDARVGCHPGGAIPLGRPAGTVTRQWRKRAHDAFDPLWGRRGEEGPKRPKAGKPSARAKAYAWLAAALGIPPAECHIGWFDAATCRRVVDLCKARKESE